MKEWPDWADLSPEDKFAIKAVCERSLLAFIQYMFYYCNRAGGHFRLNWHHRWMIREIEDLAFGRVKKQSLIINVPPGSGKSEVFTVLANAWLVLTKPKFKGLNISFSKSLMNDFSDSTRSVLKSDPISELWPVQFGKDSSDQWTLVNSNGTEKSVMYYASLGGQITGKRGGYMGPDFDGWILMDDPSKPEDMFSKVKRERGHRQAQSTVRSRRGDKTPENPTPFIFVQQRLHTDDLTGFILRGGFGKTVNVKHVVIPALVDEEYIATLPKWLRKRCLKDVSRGKKVDGRWAYWPMEDIDDMYGQWEANEYDFMASMMQAPIKLGGNLFKSDWWQYYGKIETYVDENGKTKREEFGPDLPKPATWEYRFVTADTAQKDKEHNDFSVFCHWGVYEKRVYLIDMYRERVLYDSLRDEFKEFVMKCWNYKDENPGHYGELRDLLVEDKASGTSLISDVESELPLAITAVQRSKDKLTRAMDVLNPIKRGCVVLPYGERFNTIFVTEHSEFSIDDTHKHDDIVDNCIDAVEHAILQGTGSAAASIMEDFYS